MAVRPAAHPPSKGHLLRTRTIIALSAAAGIAAIGAIGSATGGTPTANHPSHTTTTTAQTATTAPRSPASEYLAALASDGSVKLADAAVNDPTGSVRLARVFCGDLSSGTPFPTAMDQLLLDATDYGFTSNDAGVMAGASVRYFCPSFEHAAEQYVEANS